jgi:hypothetical protein
VKDRICDLAGELAVGQAVNRLPEEYGGVPIFAAPVIGVARGDDPVFERFKDVAGPRHLTPLDLWKASGLPDEDNVEKKLRVLALAFPYSAGIREAGKKAVDGMPPDIYCLARNWANHVIRGVMEGLTDWLRTEGYGAVIGVVSPAYNISREDDPCRVRSNWSERHVAFAAGLGSFGLHAGLITEVGSSIRLGSLVTDAPLEITPRISDEPYHHCLFHANGPCGACISRCPGGAVSDRGHDKSKCRAYGRRVAEKVKEGKLAPLLRTRLQRVNGVEREQRETGCALCQFAVPCSDRCPGGS